MQHWKFKSYELSGGQTLYVKKVPFLQIRSYNFMRQDFGKPTFVSTLFCLI